MALDDILKALTSTRRGFGARNVVEALEPKVTWRAPMMIPSVEYDDGSVGIGWPREAIAAKEALGRFGNAVDQAFSGRQYAPEDTFPRDEDAILPQMAFIAPAAGTLAKGARRTAVPRSVAGAERAEASSGLPSQVQEAGRFDFTPGAPRSADIGRSSLSYLPEDGMVELTALGTPEAYRGQGAATQAMQQFTGALDEAGLPSRLVARGDAGTDPTRLQSFYQAHGYGAPGPDGYMVRPAKPTGETLFSNPKDAAPAGLLATGEGEEDDLPPIVRALLSKQSIGGGW
jgi:GNAT superfamily N-acetyltransferase